MRNLFAASAATIALCLATGQAIAQTAPASAGPGPAADAGGIGEIVVTAQHRTENAQSVPISVSAIAGDMLTRNNVSSLQDLAGSVPSLVVSKSVSYGLAPISIRGLGGPAGGGSLLTDQPVAVYVDGVYVPALGQSVSDFLDVDSVQVLRGPQGTLYGRNSTAGAVLLTSKRPTNELGGEAHVGYGSFDEFKISGALNVPLVSDVLALRAAIGRNSGGNWAKNTIDSRTFGGGTSTSGRLSLRYRPTSDLTIDLIADHATGTSRPATLPLATVIPVFAGPFGLQYSGNPYARRVDFADALDSRKVQIVADQFTRTRSTDLSLLADWKIGGLTLTSITGYRKFRVNGAQDASPFTVPAAAIGTNNTDQHQKSVSQELRLASSGRDAFRWTLGLYYFHQDTDAFITIVNLQAGPPAGGKAAGTTADFTAGQKVNSYAAFLDASYDISSRLSLTGGIRVSRDEKQADITNVIRTIATDATLANVSCPSATVDCAKSFDNVSPRAVINFKPSGDNLLYASFSKGFNSGGFNNFGNVASPTDPTNPLENASEKITSYELGSKNEFFDRALRLNLSAFVTDYQDLHIRQAVLTGGVAIVNVPKARIKGVELESVIAPIEHLTFTLNGSYLDGTIRKGSLAALASTAGTIRFGNQVAPVIEDVAGNHLTRAPKWQGYASANYRLPTAFGSISATGSLRFQSKTYFLETNQDVAQYAGKAWREVDIRVAVAGIGNRWELALFGRNILDNRHISQIVPFSGFPIATLNSPRSWGLSASYKF